MFLDEMKIDRVYKLSFLNIYHVFKLRLNMKF